MSFKWPSHPLSRNCSWQVYGVVGCWHCFTSISGTVQMVGRNQEVEESMFLHPKAGDFEEVQ